MRVQILKTFISCPLDRFEYMRMRIDLIPQELIDLYNIGDKVKYDSKGVGYVYMEIRKGMYGLPQSVILSNNLLK